GRPRCCGAFCRGRALRARAGRHGRAMKFIHSISRINIAISSGSGLATGAMMVVIIIDVIGRAFFASPMPLATEISVMLLIAKVFLGMSGAQATDSNFQVTVL